ncbi:carbohydrate ABC transporter permease [Bariatricus massiliensis]|uniref:Carbohydrate ABC transporter permease n=1 Tax=Bariatricus massiliensis TaxID=1745713 RepID=A0ABS8DHC1_9FIRM|nr:carbohydrate ABC transporter permease [Bariatricus massiliensis]MCB7304357.1 carbohydrate ABC transporter permease [Bariatricus massiliensis]MCB7375008.1 carbohydrate ABC transporter permease [Bariatricus massiliensis]MCB7387467.1 carbohydrate ABC transporter permease [Bariatricus massiliensis]MCB7411629.1 carbohydrate ABC transporter permease [Bariatricus massiliensis]MCQ5253764.1 carbohydrate ABC transporter permease [Bariatricus massiliensis]
MREKHTGKIIANTILSLIILMPLYWTFITSVKGKNEIYQQPPQLLPKGINWTNYKEILLKNDGVFLGYLKNSVVTTLLTMILVAAVSLLAGYALSKMQVKGKKIVMLLIISALMIPFQTLMIPLYSVMANLGLTNSRLSMILIYATFQTPFAIYMMKNAFDAIPDGLREAAQIDGAGDIRIFFKIMMPTTWASIATIFIYSAYTTWNDYLIAVVFANNDSIKTFNVGLTNLAIGQYGTEWGLLTAGSIIGLAPIMLLFIFLQKYFIKGMLGGAMK